MLIHKDHVSAVMDVAFSPTGREFVSGSYDRTVRIFSTTGGRSRDVYHTKRMQRIFCVNYSADARFVLSGSDDTNVRIWKAEASDTLGRGGYVVGDGRSIHAIAQENPPLIHLLTIVL